MGAPAIANTRRAQRAALLSAGVNLALAGVKLTAGLVGHSYALVADALESTVDIAASGIVFSGLRIAALPEDENHPYGHGKAEALAALIVCGLLGLAGVGIAVQAVREIVTPHTMPAPFTIWVLLAVVAVKEGLFRVMRRLAQETQSTAVRTDAWHNRADALTSLFAGAGIAVALIGGPGYEAADDWGALAASGVVLVNAFVLLQGPLRELMDAAPREVIARVHAAAAVVPGVLLVEKVMARKGGPTYHVDMHIHVDGAMPVREAHALAGRVKSTIREGVPSVRDVLIHVEPHGTTGTTG